MDIVGLNLSFPIDEDGFIALVCPDSYTGFIDEDWTMGQLMDRFVEQMNLGRAFIAYPGPDAADEHFSLVSGRDGSRVVREAGGTVTVGEAGLVLSSYTQLTMAAQFEDEAAAGSNNSLRLPCAPGTYRVALRELDGAGPAFELELRPDDAPEMVPHTAVPWFEV